MQIYFLRTQNHVPRRSKAVLLLWFIVTVIVRPSSVCLRPFEPPHDKTNKMTCAPSKDSDQPGPPPSPIRVFVVRSMGS